MKLPIAAIGLAALILLTPPALIALADRGRPRIALGLFLVAVASWFTSSRGLLPSPADRPFPEFVVLASLGWITMVAPLGIALIACAAYADMVSDPLAPRGNMSAWQHLAWGGIALMVLSYLRVIVPDFLAKPLIAGGFASFVFGQLASLRERPADSGSSAA